MEDNSDRNLETRRWLTLPRAVAIISVLIVMGVAVATLSAKPHKQVTVSASGPPSRTPTPKPVMVKANKPFVVQSADPDPSERFTITNGQGWDLDWSYDCSMHGGLGTFIVSIYDGTGRASAETPPVIQSGASGRGTHHYTKSGTHFFGVRSECAWQLAVKATS